MELSVRPSRATGYVFCIDNIILLDSEAVHQFLTYTLDTSASEASDIIRNLLDTLP